MQFMLTKECLVYKNEFYQPFATDDATHYELSKQTCLSCRLSSEIL